MTKEKKQPVIYAHLVTRNAARYIEKSLLSVIKQDHFVLGETLFITVTDNDSTDSTTDIVSEKFKEDVLLIKEATNTGYSGAHNAGISRALKSGADYVFVLNPDLLLDPLCLYYLVQALEHDPRAGFSSPKLLRANQDLQPIQPPTIDAAGMYITPEIRHLDRGSQKEDQEEYNKPCYLFGASGAAVLMRRNFLFDVSLSLDPNRLEIFDELFFAYREDADLSWRAQSFGWKCRYEPMARGYHERQVLPEKRRSLPPFLNRLGVQNRFLLLFNNFSFIANLHCVLPCLFRNIVVLAAVCTVERTSLPALTLVIKNLPSRLQRRKEIQRRVRVHPFEVGKWFSKKPVVEDLLSLGPTKEFIKSVVVIIINYNSGSRLTQCLRAIEKSIRHLQETYSASVIVVDNASEDTSAKDAALLFSSPTNKRWCFIDFVETNLGFAGGINHAVSHHPADCYLVLNPDVSLQEDTLRTLLESFENYPSLGVVSPILLDTNQVPQKGFIARNFPGLLQTLLDLFYLDHLFPNNPWTTHYFRSNDTFLNNYIHHQLPPLSTPYDPLDKPLLVSQPPASCMLIRHQALSTLHGFDESFYPAWFEDVDFCKRLSETKYQSAIYLKATALHEGGYSKKELGDEVFSEIWYRNMLRYWKKHGTLLEYLTLRICFPVAMLVRSFLTTVRAFFVKASPEKRSALFSLAKTYAKLSFTVGRRFKNRSNCFSNKRTLVSREPVTSPPETRTESRTMKQQNEVKIDPHLFLEIFPPQGFVDSDLENVTWSEYLSRELFSGKGLLLGRPSKEDEGTVQFERVEQPEILLSFPEHSLDFLIVERFFECMKNPLLSLSQWISRVKPGGHLLLRCERKEHTINRSRPRTTLEHLILDYKSPSAERTFQHYLDYVTLALRKSGDEAISVAKALLASNDSAASPIPLHILLPEDLLKVVTWFSKHISPITLQEEPVMLKEKSDYCLLLKIP